MCLLDEERSECDFLGESALSSGVAEDNGALSEMLSIKGREEEAFCLRSPFDEDFPLPDEDEAREPRRGPVSGVAPETGPTAGLGSEDKCLLDINVDPGPDST